MLLGLSPPAGRRMQTFSEIAAYKLELAQSEHAIIIGIRAADIHRIDRTGGKTRSAHGGPGPQIGGNLHLVDEAGLRVPVEEETLRCWLQADLEDALASRRICAGQKLVIVGDAVTVAI